MKKGFTLIELLAVIVILAIIALIATPIILGIINDAREESNERSVELYASAVRNAIASYQLTNPNAPKSFSDLDVQYEGKVECTTKELYEDGSFYLEGCTVNGSEKTYSYGTKQNETPDTEETPDNEEVPDVEETPSTQVYKPQYYSRTDYGYIGGDLPSDAKTTVSELNTYGNPIYLGLDVDANNKVSAAYSCFVRNETEYCLKGYDSEAFATNNTILLDAFGESACSFEDDRSVCSFADGLSELPDGLYASADSYGLVDASDGYDVCTVSDGGGEFSCSEL